MTTIQQICQHEGCKRAHSVKGFCGMHYHRQSRGADMDAPVRGEPRQCEHPGCPNVFSAKGLCRFHRRRQLKGISLDLPMRITRLVTSNEVCTYNECGRIASRHYLCESHYYRQCHGLDMSTPIGGVGAKRLCSHEGCERAHDAKGLCSLHYSRWRNGHDMDTPQRVRGPIECKHDGCNRTQRTAGYCNMHYTRSLKNSDMDDPRSGPLRIADRRGYIHLSIGPGKRMLEHRYVMELHLRRSLFETEQVHHINGDRADNQINNLELWTRSQPSGQRVADKLQWAAEFLTEYGLTVTGQMPLLD